MHRHLLPPHPTNKRLVCTRTGSLLCDSGATGIENCPAQREWYRPSQKLFVQNDLRWSIVDIKECTPLRHPYIIIGNLSNAKRKETKSYCTVYS
jgi:hypothetical protein